MMLRLSWPAGVDLPGLHLACAVDVIGGWVRAGHRRIELPGRTPRDLINIEERIRSTVVPPGHHLIITITDPACPALEFACDCTS